MSIGRIEMVDGKKQYVRYATLGGSGGESGIQVGNVQDLTLKEGSENLTLTWKDPEDVVFNGETIGKWAGTKVVRKEGNYPTGTEDGMLIADSQVRDQYSETGLEDTGVMADVEYSYTLFPYTDKNIITYSDVNRITGSVAEYLPVLQDNTWDMISQATTQGIAKDLWSIGDTKDGYVIVGFDHDDLADGSGKAGITFALEKQNDDIQSKWNITEKTTQYWLSSLNQYVEGLYAGLPEELKRNVKKVKKYCKSSLTTADNLVSEQEMFLFSFALAEVVRGTDVGQYFLGEGTRYEGDLGSANFGSMYWTRTFTYNGVSSWIISGNKGTDNNVGYSRHVRYGFCV